MAKYIVLYLWSILDVYSDFPGHRSCDKVGRNGRETLDTQEHRTKRKAKPEVGKEVPVGRKRGREQGRKFQWEGRSKMLFINSKVILAPSL